MANKLIDLIFVVFDFLTQSYFGVFLFLFIGIKTIRDSLKNKENVDTPFYISGWVGSIMLICGSIMISYMKIFGKM